MRQKVRIVIQKDGQVTWATVSPAGIQNLIDNKVVFRIVYIDGIRMQGPELRTEEFNL